MNRPTVLVLGARGRLGAAAVTAFAAAGWRVLAQARGALPGLPPGTQALPIALDQTEALASAAREARAVVYAVNPPYTEWDRQMLPLARQGMAVAERLNALFMLPGNVYAFGEGMPARLDERTPERPTTAKGRLRQALEAEMAGHAGLRSVVLRAGDFFGAGIGSYFDLVIVKSLAVGRLTYPGPLDAEHAWAYLPDLARAFVAVAQRDDGAPGARRLHFAGHTMTGAQCLAAVAQAAGELGLAPPGGFRHRRLPWPLIRAAGLVWPMGRELARMSHLWRVPHRLDGDALEAAAGPLAATPLVTALRDSLLALGHGQRMAQLAAS